MSIPKTPVVNWNPVTIGGGPPDYPQGPQGPAGPAGPIGPPGPPGPEGPEGPQGVGQPGPGWKVMTRSPQEGEVTGDILGTIWFNSVTSEAWTLIDNSVPYVWRYDGVIVGKQGEQGETGDTGPQGPPGGAPSWQGEWSPAVDYANNAAVSLNGSSWYAAGDPGLGVSPPSPPWQQIAQKGDTGPQGPQGIQGVQGNTGAQGPIGPAGPQGNPGPQGNTGMQGNPGPAGPAGPEGIQGAQGPAGATGPQGQIGPSSSVHEEYVPANAATTVTLSQVPQAILVLARDGVVQSQTAGNYSLAGSTLTFTDAFSGTERVIVDYASTSYTPVPPVSGAGIAPGTIPSTALADRSVTNVKLASDTARANLLTNGGFEIWQRGNGPFTVNAYNADRWQGQQPSGSISVSRDTANVATPDSVACAVVTAVKSGASCILVQSLEGPNLRGRTLTLSVAVKTSTANAVRVGLYDGAALQWSAYHTGNGTYQVLTATATLSNAVAGTNVVQITFDASCTAYIDNAMLVVGSVPADYAPLHPADDLARCQRYYEILGPDGELGMGGYCVASGYLDVMGFYKVQKSVMPTATKNGAFTVNNCAQPTVVVIGRGSSTIRTIVTATANASWQSAAGNITVEANP